MTEVKPGGRFVLPCHVFGSRSNETSFHTVTRSFGRWNVHNNLPRVTPPQPVAEGSKAQ
jgi:hypothetical protein